MADSSGKGSDSEDATGPNSSSFAGSGKRLAADQKKTCADCGTSKTPLWRGGPAGPKSLCNACGIRSCKKKRAILGISSKGSGGIVNFKKGKRSSSSNSGSLNLKRSLLALGREVMMHRSSHRTKLGEEEQAAILLMSLSYGSVYA